MLIQNMLRRPAEFTGAPPVIGPAALVSPDTLPAPPIACARPGGGWAGNVFVVVYDTAGFSIDPRRSAARGTR